MQSPRKAPADRSEPHTAPANGYLNPVSFDDTEDTGNYGQSLDAGSQAWGDYLEQMEGYEI
jgi:hypothetical protein